MTYFYQLPNLGDESTQVQEARNNPELMKMISGFASHVDIAFCDSQLWNVVGVRVIAVRPFLAIGDKACGGAYTSGTGLMDMSLEFPNTPYGYACVLAHEFGHGIDNSYRVEALSRLRSDPFRIQYHEWRKQWTAVHADGNQFTAYAKTNLAEDIAESFSFYAENHTGMKLRSPERFELCHQALVALVPDIDERRQRMLDLENEMEPNEVVRHRFQLWINKMRMMKGVRYPGASLSKV